MRPVRRVVLLIALVVAGVLGVLALADGFKFRADTGAADSRAVIRWDAQARDGSATEDPALTLWKECASNLDHVHIVAGPVPDGDDWTITIEPALGELTQRKLIGCLNDMTVDGILGHHLGTEQAYR